jgi:hypothetical protein
VLVHHQVEKETSGFEWSIFINQKARVATFALEMNIIEEDPQLPTIPVSVLDLERSGDCQTQTTLSKLLNACRFRSTHKIEWITAG